MQMTRRAAVAGIALAGVHPRRSTAQSFADIEREVQAAAQEFLGRTSAPGISIGLLTRSGRHLFQFGQSHPGSNQAVTEGTLFELGSISKVITVILAELAVGEGAIRWDDAPGRHVPEVSGRGTDQITLLHLATHCTGGMPLQFPPHVKTRADAAAWFRDWMPPARPGTVRSYANPSIALLAVVVARALGGEFARLAQQRVLEPLGLSGSFYDIPAGEMPRYAQGHSADGRAIRLGRGVFATEAYGLRSTASDVLRLLEAHMGRVETPQSLARAMQATQLGRYRSGPLTQAAVWEWFPAPASLEIVQAGSSDAMVFRANPATPLNVPTSPPQGALVNKTGGTGGFGAYAAFWPDRRRAMVILANRNHPVSERLAFAGRLRGLLDA